MKKFFASLMAAVIVFSLISPTIKVEAVTKTELEKKVKTLEATVSKQKKTINTKDKEIKGLKGKITIKDNEVKTLKSKVPVVRTGKIYKDGVSSGSSNFVSMADKNYVEIESILPLLTIYKDNDFNFNKTDGNLYFGIMPRNGVISLTNLNIYDIYKGSDNIYINRWDSSGFVINGKKYSTGIGSEIWYEGSPDVTYKLDGKYSTMKFKYGMDDDTDINGNIVIYGDGNVLFDSEEIERLEDAKEVSIDVKGVKFIKVEFNTIIEGRYYTNPVIAEPVLIP